jgi:hypothetical protein
MENKGIQSNQELRDEVPIHMNFIYRVKYKVFDYLIQLTVSRDRDGLQKENLDR